MENTSIILLVLLFGIILYFVYQYLNKDCFKSKDLIKKDIYGQSQFTENIPDDLGKNIEPDFYSDGKTEIVLDDSCNVVPEGMLEKDENGNLIVPERLKKNKLKCMKNGKESYENIIKQTNDMINNNKKRLKRTVKFVDDI